MKFKIIRYFLLFTLLLQFVLSNESNKKGEKLNAEENDLLMKEINQKNEDEYYLKINFEENIRNTVDKIMLNSNKDNELSTLFGYLFGYNDLQKQQKEKQSKMEQISDYIQSINEIVNAHRYSIDYVKVQKLSHELALSSKQVYQLNDQETEQLEKNLFRITNFIMKTILNSFGLQESNKKDKSENIINDHLYVDNVNSKKDIDKQIEVINSITEKNIKQLAHHIVFLANRNPEYSSAVLGLLDVENSKEEIQENAVSSFLKVTLSFIRSLLVFLAAVDEEIHEGAILDNLNGNKMPTWLSESTMKDIQSLYINQIMNPKTIIAFNKLFVRDSRPLEKEEKETLTHQLIDLGYSIIYGQNAENQINTNEGVATVEKSNEKFMKKQSVNQELINRIINLAYETDEKSKQNNYEGLFYRTLRLFFSLFHISDSFEEQVQQQNVAEKKPNNEQIQQNQKVKPSLQQHPKPTAEEKQKEDNKLKDNIKDGKVELVPEEYNNKIENYNNDENNQDEVYIDYDYDYENEEQSKIKYIAKRVNKLVEKNQEAINDDEKRAESVFRILYNIYLNFYGLQDENQLDETKPNKVVEQVDKVKQKRQDEENRLIQEVVPMLDEKDIANVLIEIDRAAQQLGYKTRTLEENEQAENFNEIEKKERDLSHFEYAQE